MSELPDSTRVLIVEDEADIRDGLADLFRDEGYYVATARDGAEGLRAACAFRPDLVLLDLAMPVLDGFRFLERWRTDPTTAGVSVIVLTARHGVDVPGCEVVAKPFDVDALLSVVERVAGATRGAIRGLVEREGEEGADRRALAGQR